MFNFKEMSRVSPARDKARPSSTRCVQDPAAWLGPMDASKVRHKKYSTPSRFGEKKYICLRACFRIMRYLNTPCITTTKL